MADLALQFRNLAKSYKVHLYGKSREVLAYDQVFMLKTLRCPVRVVWVYRKTRWVALFTTDLRLSVGNRSDPRQLTLDTRHTSVRGWCGAQRVGVPPKQA